MQIDKQEVFEAIPQQVISNLIALLQDIAEAGVYGGEITSAKIEDLNRYQQKLSEVKI